MSFVSRAIIVAVASVALGGVIACGGADQAGTKSAEPAAAPQATSADVKARMDEHFARVETVQQAVIRGDLEGVKESATWVADHQELAGLPASLQPQIEALKNAARAAAAAADIKGAAHAAAEMSALCGSCHQAANAKPAMTPPAAPAAAATGASGHMRAHQLAADLMYEGLIGPSDEAWSKGADEFKKAPLAHKDFPKDPKLTKEIEALEDTIHARAERAGSVVGTEARVTLYGELTAACAHCHSLHGDVWGPGLPGK